MHLTWWHAEPGTALGSAFAAHLHGRDLEVVSDDQAHRWHWIVTSPHGTLLADGFAVSRDAAELAAEDEATAVHPPTPELLDRLLG
jgi:hypothetical protein